MNPILQVVGALPLLAIPGVLLLPRHPRLRTFEELQYNWARGVPHRHPWFFVPLYLLDPIRAWLGAFILLEGLQQLDSAVPGPPAVALGILLAPCLVLQCLTLGKSRSQLAPLFYVGGLALAVVPLYAALPVLAVAAAGVGAFRSWTLFFVAGAGAMVAATVLLRIPLLDGLVMSALFFIPAFVGWYAQTALVLPCRR